MPHRIGIFSALAYRPSGMGLISQLGVATEKVPSYVLSSRICSGIGTSNQAFEGYLSPWGGPCFLKQCKTLQVLFTRGENVMAAHHAASSDLLSKCLQFSSTTHCLFAELLSIKTYFCVQRNIHFLSFKTFFFFFSQMSQHTCKSRHLNISC